MSEETNSESSGAPGGQAAVGADELAPPRMYRPMKADGAFPMAGASATTLGARTPKDIPVDAQGRVRPETGGMSVRPRIAGIPAAFLPRRLKHLNRNAGGSESVVVFRYGDVNASFAGPRWRRRCSCGPTPPVTATSSPGPIWGTTPTRLRSTRRARDG